MKIAILGTGAYGMALASIFDYNKCDIMMWTNSTEEMELLIGTRKSNKIDYYIPSNISISTDMNEVVKESSIIVIAVPTKFVNSVSRQLKNYYDSKQVICIASKGIEQDTCLFLYDVVRNNIDTNNITVISGGTFAVDIINKVPVGLSIATNSNYARDLVIKTMQNDYVKLRYTKDIIGTEICGSIKNVIAIASGILEGLGYKESTRSFLITESLHDIKELIKGLGGNKKSILSFAGVGDLLLTATSEKSRNYSYGILLGSNDFEASKKYLEETTVEGYYTLKSIYTLIRRKKIKMPIIDLIYKIVMNGENPNLLAKFLMDKK